MIAGPPPPDTVVPDDLLVAAEGVPLTLVWLNNAGGLTARTNEPASRFIKWNPIDSGESLREEAERLRWLGGRHPAPHVIEYRATKTSEMLVTEAIPDTTNAVTSPWTENADQALRAIATGLRQLHSLSIDGCPFSWSVPHRLAASNVDRQVAAELLASAPPVDKLVVSHGDACAPNTLLSPDGEFAATVDVARLGVADRWADLAVATLSLSWSYESFDEEVFWDEYGIAPDHERIEYYRALHYAT